MVGALHLGARKERGAEHRLETDDRPLITFAVFAYNQVRWVRAAVEAALAQTWTPLQIILSDDGSTDGTFAIMEELAHSYHGPHQVQLNRNPRNLGIGGHVNRVMELVAGDLVVVAAGDDISVPHRTASIAEVWLGSGRRAMSIHSAVTEMDADGSLLSLRGFNGAEALNDTARVARKGIGILGASHAWAREVFDRFGPMMSDIVNEDVVIPFRSSLLGTVAYIEEPLVRYRVGQSSWHGVRGGSTEVDTLRERTRFHFRLAHINAIQAYTDALRFDDSRITDLTRTRLLETWFMWQVSEGRQVRLSDTVATALSGASLPKMIVWALNYRNRPFYRLFLKLKG